MEFKIGDKVVCLVNCEEYSDLTKGSRWTIRKQTNHTFQRIAYYLINNKRQHVIAFPNEIKLANSLIIKEKLGIK